MSVSSAAARLHINCEEKTSFCAANIYAKGLRNRISKDFFFLIFMYFNESKHTQIIKSATAYELKGRFHIIMHDDERFPEV